MAIISEVEGLEVTILVNGRDAKEYEDPKLEVLRATNSDTDAGNRPSSTTAVCVKYIEAYPGDFFAIHFKKHNQFLTTSREISCRVEADGRLIRELPWSLKLLRYPLSFGDICTKTTSGKFASLQLQFGKLEIVPDQDCSPEKLFIDALQAHAYGTIRVHFLHIHDALRAGQVLDDCIPQAPTTVAEKYCAGKALSVSTQCTVSSTYPYRSLGRRHGYINHDPLQRPLATIEFRCRSQGTYSHQSI
ncbi:hypothetical protein GGR56DRAFT_565043 [Xylariaceae sp. FL0804]|nr:hypothetical protein GGR56DRAFT_565043 [Xylariaceae sp. FL0804]